MKKITLVALIMLICVSAFSSGVKESGSDEVVLHWYSHSSSLAKTQEVIVDKFMQENPNIKIEVVELPENTNDKLQALLIALQSGDSSIDFFNADVTWTATFASAGLIDNLDESFTKEDQKDYLPGTIKSATFNNHIWGIPFRTDSGVLYYRKDLLEKYGFDVPKTYEQLFDTAKMINEKESKTRYAMVGSLKNGEGLTCNAVEWFYSNNGDVINENGKIVINSENNRQILQVLVDAYQNKLLPEGVLSYGSGDARASMFQDNQIFMRAWPKAYAMSQDPDKSQVVGKIGVSPLPSGSMGNHGVGVVGGWQLFLNKNSVNKDAAIKFMKFYSSEYAQKLHALNDSFMPARKSLYSDSDILTKYPYYELFPSVLDVATARPQSPYYSEISSILSAEVQNAMKGSKTVEKALSDAQFAMEKIN